MNKLVISEKDYDSIIKYAKSKLPNEACGLMAGYQKENMGIVQKVYLLTNIKDSSQAYQLDPEEQVEVFNEIEEHNMELISIFHSHPVTPPRPSIKDLKEAYYPEVIYTIISLINDRPEMRAFKIQEGNYWEIEVIIK